MTCNMREAAFAIRYATSDDIDAVVELAQSTFRDAYRLLDDPDDIEAHVVTEFTPSRFASMLADPTSILFVALEQQRYVGYVHVKRSAAPPCVTGPSPIELAQIYLMRIPSCPRRFHPTRCGRGCASRFSVRKLAPSGLRGAVRWPTLPPDAHESPR
jgi:hypothetical protein